MKNQMRRAFISVMLLTGAAAMEAFPGICQETANADPPQPVQLPEAAEVTGGSLSGPYCDPSYFVKVPWGSHSHWLQPVRVS